MVMILLSLLFVIVTLLLWLIYKLNVAIGMYYIYGEKQCRQGSVLSGFGHALGGLEHLPDG